MIELLFWFFILWICFGELSVMAGYIYKCMKAQIDDGPEPTIDDEKRMIKGSIVLMVTIGIAVLAIVVEALIRG